MNRKSSSSSDDLKKSAVVDESEDDGFVARRSTKVTGPSKADGDTWQETLAVCELAGKLTIRSYYTNRRTKQREWDEPPSGASHVIAATETMRRMAQIQLQEMQIATGRVPDPTAATTPSKEKKKGFFGSFRRSNSKVEPSSNSSSPKLDEEDAGEQHVVKPRPPKIQYRSDSFMGKVKKESKKHNKYDENLDLSMQRALASSLACIKPGGKAELGESDDEELERALKISMAEAKAHRGRDRTPQRGSKRESSRERLPSQSRRSLSRDKSIPHLTLPTVSSPRGRLPSGSSTPKATQPHNDRPPRSRQASAERYKDSPDELALAASSTHKSTTHVDRPPRPKIPSHADRHDTNDEGQKQQLEIDVRPDPPAADDSPMDGSIIHLEFSHSEEEALEIALRMSLLEAEKQGKAGTRPEPKALVHEKDISEMTEEEQLALAMAESMNATVGSSPQHQTSQATCSEGSVSSEKENKMLRDDNQTVEKGTVESHTMEETATTNDACAPPDFPGTSYMMPLKGDEDEGPRMSRKGGAPRRLSPHRSKVGRSRSLSPVRDTTPMTGPSPHSPTGNVSLKSPKPDQSSLSSTSSHSPRSPNGHSERGQGRRLSREETLQKEQRMLQKALRASVRDLGASATPDISGGDKNTAGNAQAGVIAKKQLLAAKEERMLQKALRASVRDLGAHHGANGSIEEKTTNARHYKHRDDTMAAREEKMLQMALKASVRDLGTVHARQGLPGEKKADIRWDGSNHSHQSVKEIEGSRSPSGERSLSPMRETSPQMALKTTDLGPNSTPTSTAEVKSESSVVSNPDQDSREAGTDGEVSVSSSIDELLELALNGSLGDPDTESVPPPSQVKEKQEDLDTPVSQASDEQTDQGMAPVSLKAVRHLGKGFKASVRNIMAPSVVPRVEEEVKRETKAAANRYRQKSIRQLAPEQGDADLQKALRASMRHVSPAATMTDNNIDAKNPLVPDDKSASRQTVPKHKQGGDGGAPTRRKLTEEEIAAREERMLQKAMKESLRINKNEAKRNRKRTPEEVLKMKEEQMLEMALRASLSENTENQA